MFCVIGTEVFLRLRSVSFCCCCLVLISKTLQVSRNTQKWNGHASELRAELVFVFLFFGGGECVPEKPRVLYTSGTR